MDMDRIMGILTLKAPTYRQVADDPNATTPAAIITAIAALIGGLGQGLVTTDAQGLPVMRDIGGAIIFAILTIVMTFIIWFIGAWVLAFVSKWFGGKTNTQEMLRVTGYVNIFGIVGVLTLLALALPVLGCLVGLVTFVIAILRLIGFIIGVREAAEFSTGNAIITAIVAVVVQVVIYAVVFGVLAGILGLGAAALGVAQ